MSITLNNFQNIAFPLKIRYNFKYLNWSEEKVDSKGNFEFSPMVPLVVS